MNTIRWQEEYSVGIKELDDQHHRLLDTINEVIDDQKDIYDPEIFSTKIAWLIHYAYTHFATEEKYLMHAEFPELKEHILEHIDFILKTLGLALRIEDGNDKNRKELILYLNSWFSSHVLVIDRRYIPFITSKKNI